MRLSRAGEYAVRCILYLSLNPNEVVPRREIASKMQVPYQFLGKIGQELARAGLIHITRGAHGGFSLVRKPEDISLLDVVEAMEGMIFLNDCLIWPETCSRSKTCSVHQVWQKAQDSMKSVLASATFADMAACEAGDITD